MLSLQQQNYWREVYRAAHPGWLPATEAYAEEIKALLASKSRLLDIGCGRGGVVEQLVHDPSLMTGVDPDAASLREHRLAALARVAGLSDVLPFVAGEFDVVIASWLFEHLGDPEGTFREVARVLRPGGAFVFVTPNAGHPLTRLNRAFGQAGRLQGRLVAALYGRAEADTFRTVYRANSAGRLSALARQAGLTLVRLQAIADPSYLAFTPLTFRLARAVDRILPSERHIHLVGVVRKDGAQEGD